MVDVPGAIEIAHLRVRYGAIRAVDDLSLVADAGTVTALLGPNGAGKTSTVEVISGLRRADAGAVRVLGRDPGDPGIKARMGVMLQTGGLYPTARPLEWLEYLARLYPTAADPRVLLDLVGIDPTTRTTTRRMSGGEQQRVKLAAALLPEPEVLILDEPTAGLDPQARRALLEELRRRRDHGVAVLLTTHQLPDVEELADHVAIMAAGRLLCEGTLDELTGTQDAVTFGGPRHLPTAGLAAALPSGYSVVETSPGTYVVHGAPSPQVIATITAWCAQHQVLATSLRVGRRTLEDLIIDAAGEA